MFLAQVKKYEMRIETIYISLNVMRMVGVFLISTIFAPFQKSIGISLDEMAVLEALFWIVVALMEVPTGVLADKRGRGWSVKMGIAFFGLGLFGYSLAFNFWSALLSEIMIAIGIAFNSGASDAWLTDALTRENRSESLGKIHAQNASYITYTALLCGVGGAYIAKFLGFRTVWLLGGVSLSLAFAIALWQIKAQGEVIAGSKSNDKNAKEGRWSTVQDSRDAWLKGGSLRWATLIVMAFPLGFAFNHYWTIYLSDPWGMKDNLGIAWLIFYPMFGLGPWLITRYHAGRSKQNKKGADLTRKYEKELIILAGLLSGIGLLGAGFSRMLPSALLFCMIHEIGRGLFRPVLVPFIHRRTQSSYKATYDSLHSIIASSATVVVYLICSFILKNGGQSALEVANLWIITGTALVIISSLIYLIRPRKN